jgi:hypothetical protein
VTGTLLRALLLVASAAALAASALALAAPPFRIVDPALTPSPTADSVVQTGPAPDSLARVVSTEAPFRASRTPSSVAYDPERGLAERQEVAYVPKPALVLAGIVWEPEPSAVVEGLPGMDGARVVREGEVLSGLRVKLIDRDRVVITGLDTLWSLSVKEPWK